MSDTAIMAIKTRVRMDDLAAEAGVSLRQEAGEFKGLCPFHVDTDPSFAVYPPDDGIQRFKCFGCGAAGDICMRHRSGGRRRLRASK